MRFKASIEQETDPVATLVMHLLHSVTNAHILHLQSRSYAEHQALGEFYGAMGDLTDAFVEAYQGKKSLIQNYPADFKLPVGSAIEYIVSLGKEVADLRHSAGFPQDEELQNEVDNIANLINSTLYKLRFLK